MSYYRSLGSSNCAEQTAALTKVLPLFKNYKTVVLGDREFCSVKLANWLREQDLYFCLRLNKNEFVQLKSEIWVQLKDLGLMPGVCLFLKGIKVTKTKGFFGFNLACKWQRKYRSWTPEEGWFILTNLESLEIAIKAYKRRFDIEEMKIKRMGGCRNTSVVLRNSGALKGDTAVFILAYMVIIGSILWDHVGN